MRRHGTHGSSLTGADQPLYARQHSGFQLPYEVIGTPVARSQGVPRGTTG